MRAAKDLRRSRSATPPGRRLRLADRRVRQLMNRDEVEEPPQLERAVGIRVRLLEPRKRAERRGDARDLAKRAPKLIIVCRHPQLLLNRVIRRAYHSPQSNRWG